MAPTQKTIAARHSLNNRIGSSGLLGRSVSRSTLRGYLSQSKPYGPILVARHGALAARPRPFPWRLNPASVRKPKAPRQQVLAGGHGGELLLRWLKLGSAWRQRAARTGQHGVCELNEGLRGR